jgi:hypothetical protein
MQRRVRLLVAKCTHFNRSTTNIRQYFRFSLRDLFVLMIFVAVVLAVDANHRMNEARLREVLHRTAKAEDELSYELRYTMSRHSDAYARLRLENEGLRAQLSRLGTDRGVGHPEQ